MPTKNINVRGEVLLKCVISWWSIVLSIAKYFDYTYVEALSHLGWKWFVSLLKRNTAAAAKAIETVV